jgi:hypothetical protein
MAAVKQNPQHRAADYVGATCTSARIALRASAIPHQPGIAELAAQLALEVAHPRRAGFPRVHSSTPKSMKSGCGRRQEIVSTEVDECGLQDAKKRKKTASNFSALKLIRKKVRIHISATSGA